MAKYNLLTYLLTDGSVTIHHRNIRLLAVEMFKVKNNMSAESVSELFESRVINYNLRSQNDFLVENKNTTGFGIKSLSFLGPKIWNILPMELKCIQDFNQFKSKIKTWIPLNCPCKTCCN